jgi:hypothetical protein
MPLLFSPGGDYPLGKEYFKLLKDRSGDRVQRIVKKRGLRYNKVLIYCLKYYLKKNAF